MSLSEVPGFQMKSPVTGVDTSLQFSVRSVLKTPNRETNKLLFVFPSELDRKELLLKTSAQTLIVGHGEIKMILTGKLPPGWLVLIIEEIVVQASEQEESQQS